MLAKLTSRKFWITIISIIAGILSLLGTDDQIITAVSSIALILVPAIIYIITEGKIDAAALQQIDIEQLAETIQKLFRTTETIGPITVTDDALSAINSACTSLDTSKTTLT